MIQTLDLGGYIMAERSPLISMALLFAPTVCVVALIWPTQYRRITDTGYYCPSHHTFISNNFGNNHVPKVQSG